MSIKLVNFFDGVRKYVISLLPFTSVKLERIIPQKENPSSYKLICTIFLSNDIGLKQNLFFFL